LAIPNPSLQQRLPVFKVKRIDVKTLSKPKSNITKKYENKLVVETAATSNFTNIKLE